MKNIKLPGISLDVQIRNNIEYQYDGPVENIVQHDKELFEKYHTPSKYYDLISNIGSIILNCISKKQIKSPIGGCYIYTPHESIDNALTKKGKIYIHTYSLKGIPDENSIFVKGYTETYFLLMIKKSNVLEESLKQKGICKNGFKKLNEKLIYNIGGLYAVKSHNLQLIKCNTPQIIKAQKYFLNN